MNTQIDSSFLSQISSSICPVLDGKKPDQKKLSRFFQTQTGVVRTGEDGQPRDRANDDAASAAGSRKETR